MEEEPRGKGREERGGEGKKRREGEGIKKGNCIPLLS
jgi:hypothetical protein